MTKKKGLGLFGAKKEVAYPSTTTSTVSRLLKNRFNNMTSAERETAVCLRLQPSYL